MADLVEEKQHARLSPSSSKRWLTCPASIKFTEAVGGEDKPSRYAAEGTVAHEVHELCLTKNHDAKHYLGKTITADGMKFKVNQDMVDAVQLSLDYVRDRIAEAELEGLRVELQVEVRSSLEYLGIPGLDGGTSDLILLFWDGNKLVGIEVFDYKHGQGVSVEVEGNTQAMCYGLGICAKYNAPEETPIWLTISQPRAHHPDGRIRSWEITVGDLINWQDDVLVPGAKRTMDDDAEFVPSDEGCRFCKGAGQCPKLFSRTQEIAMIDFEDTTETLPDVKTLSSEQKMFIMKHADMIRSFIVSVENQVKQEVDHGSKDYQEEFKLVRKTKHRQFTDDAFDDVFSPLFEVLSHEDIYEEKHRSLTEIERRLKKAVGVQAAKEIMAEVTHKPEGELVIAPITDNRKAEEPSIVSDFTGL